MNQGDIEYAVGCTRAEGWSSQTRHAFEDSLAYDPDGCFIAEMNGYRAGMCVATAYQRHGFIGMLIVSPKYRCAGLGTALFSHAVNYLFDRGIKNVSLDADPPGIPIYQKAGFRPMCHSLRFNGTIFGKQHPKVHTISPKDLEQVCALDSELFGDDRSFFLRRTQARFPEMCFVAKKDTSIVGYILAHPGEGVVSVGPWAMLPEVLHPLALLENLALAFPGEQLRIGVLENNPEAIRLLKATQGLVESEPSWRMVLGDANRLGQSEFLYAIGSPAKG
jgi:predicted N-acetyltransferase YhbS